MPAVKQRLPAPIQPCRASPFSAGVVSIAGESGRVAVELYWDNRNGEPEVITNGLKVELVRNEAGGEQHQPTKQPITQLFSWA